MELKKIKVWSLAKLSLIFGIIGGVLVSILFAILKRLVAGKMPSDLLLQNPTLSYIAEFNLKSAGMLFVEYAFLGLLWGVVIALLYNLIAKYFGGVKLEFAEAKKK